jgi:hypothetical protein
MSQHDYDIANGGGAAVRADINLALAAILSQNSGATAPATTKPFMYWYDTANSVLKQRNAADTAWLTIMDANGVPFGGQIKFPASQNASSDANTLDDYEEGTWTPVIGGAAGASGQSYSSQLGKYTKIGNIVWLSGGFSLSVKGTFSGAYVCVTGLPFSSIEIDAQISVGYFGNLNTNKVFVGGYTSGSLIVLTANSAASPSLTVSGLGQGDIGTNTFISFTVVYKTS